MRPLARYAFPLALLLVALASLAPLPPSAAPPGSDKLEHALAFAVLAALGLRAAQLPPRVLAFGLLAYGLGIECVQAVLPWRDFSLLDWLADAVGIALSFAMAWFFRRRRESVRP